MKSGLQQMTIMSAWNMIRKCASNSVKCQILSLSHSDYAFLNPRSYSLLDMGGDRANICFQ